MRDLEDEMRHTPTLVKRLAEDREFALEVYQALCNNKFIDIQDGDAGTTKDYWSCSWRYAGGLVADLRAVHDVSIGEWYLDWYCSGGEGNVSERVRDTFLAMGWKVESYE